MWKGCPCASSMCRDPEVKRMGTFRSLNRPPGSRVEIKGATEFGEASRGQTMQGPFSHIKEFGFDPKSCGQQGKFSAERVVQTDLCFEIYVLKCYAGAEVECE